MSTAFQRSFSGGEITPALHLRNDLSKHASALKTARNFIIMRHGGATINPGTTFLNHSKVLDQKVRIFPFVFNSDQTYIMEFGDLYIRFYQNGVRLYDSVKALTAITIASPGVFTSAAHGFVAGNEVLLSAILGTTQLNDRSFRVGTVTTNTFQLLNPNGTPLNTTGMNAYISGGTASRVFEVVTPYVTADLPSLKVKQSGDIVTLTHRLYAPRELIRVSHMSWTLSVIAFSPSINYPAPGTATAGAAGTDPNTYRIATVSLDGEESAPSPIFGVGSAPPTKAVPNTVAWSAVSGAASYVVYKEVNGIYGFLGVSQGLSFKDIGSNPNTSDTPLSGAIPFPALGYWPAISAYFQQRRFLASSATYPQRVQSSKTGFPKNFDRRSPIKADDSIDFTLNGTQINEIRHIVDIGALVLLTSNGEWLVRGDAGGTITPTDINLQQHSYYGSSSIDPIVMGGNMLYVQARGSIVRDFGFDFQIDGYRGNDLTVFAAHLFDGYSIVDWAYQQTPHSIVWLIRSDGVLLGLTYIREQDIIAWHRHDVDGAVESISTVPEGNEDAVYITVRRNINGDTRRTVERLNSIFFSNQFDCKIMQSSKTFDGRNKDVSKTMTFTGGTLWDYQETISLNSSAAFFTAGMVGSEIHIPDTDGTIIHFSINAYTSPTVVTGKPNKTISVGMRNVATSNWALAIKIIPNLWHLEGKNVSIFGDGYVIASPNNSNYTLVKVQNGIAVIEKCYTYIHVGLPLVADLQTLDIDTMQGETMVNKKKNLGEVMVQIEDTRGLFIGGNAPDDNGTTDLTEFKPRNKEGTYDPVALVSGKETVVIRPEWKSTGSVFIRQVDPLPARVLAVAPSGFLPYQGG